MQGTEFKKISVLVPTRGRVDRLRKMINSFDATTDVKTAELVFRVDDDDQVTQKFLAASGEQTIIGPRYNGYQSTPRFFNELYRASSGDVIMCGNDDMLFRTQWWSQQILEVANLYPDGLFDIGVSTHNDVNFPFATVSRKACDVLGFFFDPRIFWGDLFWRDVMAYFGRAITLPSVVIEHDWAGFHPDGVFLAGEETRRGDNMAHHAQAVEEAIQKLKDVA